MMRPHQEIITGFKQVALNPEKVLITWMKLRAADVLSKWNTASLPDQLQDQLRDHESCVLWSYDCALYLSALYSTPRSSALARLSVWNTQTHTFASTVGISQSSVRFVSVTHKHTSRRLILHPPIYSSLAHSQGQTPKDADTLQQV